MKVSPININKIPIQNKINVIKKLVSKPVNYIAPALLSSVAASAITAAAAVKQPQKEVSTEEIEINLLKRKYEKNRIGSLSKTYSNWDLKKLKLEHENYFLEFKGILFDKNFPSSRIEEFKNLININQESGRKMFDKNFDRLFETYSILDSTKTTSDIFELCKDNKQNFKIVENVVNQPMDDKLLSKILSYKSSGYMAINAALRSKAKDNNFKIGSDEQSKIDYITKYLDTQILPENLKLYRGEGYEVLNNVKVNNDQTINLGKMMDDAAKSGKEEEIQKVKEFILDNEITATEHGFMSTSITPEIVKTGGVATKIKNGGIKWKLTTGENAKGVFIEALNVRGLFSNEKEFVLQRESKIKLQEADYSKEDGLWYLKATISN